MLTIGCSGLLTGAWVHWILMGGVAAAYALFRHSDDRENDGDGSGGSNVEQESRPGEPMASAGRCVTKLRCAAVS